jgi:hypothetical protein
MEPLQLDSSNISDPSRGTSLSFSGVGHVYLAGKVYNFCMGTQTHQNIEQVAQFYPVETSEFPSHLSSLLLESYGSLPPDIRQNLVQNLVMLRNKGVITSIE